MVVPARVVHSRVMHRRWLLAVVGALACGDDETRDLGGMDATSGPQPGLDATVVLDAQHVEAGSGDAGDRCQTREYQEKDPSAFHVAGDVVYPDPPPVGGNHNQCWAKWDVYDQELADERWVHNLEHGGVVFLYRCPAGCRDEIDTMKVFVSGRTQALMTPYAALPTRFALVAWGVRLTTNCFDMPAFQSFYDAHVDNAPESLPDDPPRSCQ